MDRSPGGLRLVTAEQGSPGDPVRVEWPDQLGLGHVCHCQAGGTGEYTIGIQLKQILPNLSSMRALAYRLMGERRESTQPTRA